VSKTYGIRHFFAIVNWRPALPFPVLQKVRQETLVSIYCIAAR
jgi:hypothetical protein